MSRTPDYLYQLLPYIYRLRDAEQGEPLRALLGVINEQVNVVEEDIAQLYENWFIETCEDWVVPYIGDLVGYRPVNVPSALTDARSRMRNKIVVPRREVANTINFRRRKGTLALLEILANDVADWPARAVEFYRLLAWSQNVNHIRLSRARCVNLRVGDALDRLNSAFEETAHNVDVRRITSHRSMGRHNIPSVGLFVWRLKNYSVTDTPAYCVEKEGAQCYTFSALGNDTPLFTLPEQESSPASIAAEINVPIPIRKREFGEVLSKRPLTLQASVQYYGPARSVSIDVIDWPSRGVKGAIPRESVIPADLTDWHRYRAPKNRVLVDPVRGRVVFPTGQLPKGVTVRYQYGFSADIGGGEYPRVVSQAQGAKIYRVKKAAVSSMSANEYTSVGAAYAKWRLDEREPEKKLPAAVIEIVDSNVYEERLTIALAAGESLQIRAANGARPILRLLDYRTDQPDPFSVSGAAGSRLALDGLLISGRGIEIAGPDKTPAPLDDDGNAVRDAINTGDLCDVTIRHCTLVPGWELDCECTPQRPEEPSIVLRYSQAHLRIEHSIVGAIWVTADERTGDPVTISITDSVIDATDESALAICDEEGRIAFAQLSVVRATVIGEVIVHAASLLENSIFMSRVRVARRQSGCVRFCYTAPDSRTPRRYHCQPDFAMATSEERLRTAAATANTPADESVIAAANLREQSRVRPRFGSLRYGTPTYAQLATLCAVEIARGADDESEMGVFHDLFQPQRTANLRQRLDEYTPAGMEAGIIFES